MRFFCLCMSPAVDVTVTVGQAPKNGAVLKNVRDEENAGGKGLNVARHLASRGAEVACGGLLGKDNIAVFESELARYGIADAFVRVPGPTRRNEMIAWPGGGFKLNRAAFPDLVELPPLLAFFSGYENDTDAVFVLSGSLPACCPKDFYARCVRLLRQRGATVVLDASGEALRCGVSAHPSVIKPNAEECADLVGFVPHTPDEFRRATGELRQFAQDVIISDGASGAWFNGEFHAAPAVEAVDTTGAGDILLAEWCWRRFAENSGTAPAWAVAAGAAACTLSGGQPPAAELVERLYGAGRKC